MAAPSPKAIPLADAAELTSTGDLWLFRGTSPADRAIRLFTNAPVNHVAVALTLDDLPPSSGTPSWACPPRTSGPARPSGAPSCTV